MSGIYNNDLPNIRKFQHNSSPIYIYCINDLYHTLKQLSYNYYKLQDDGYWKDYPIKHYHCDNCSHKYKIQYTVHPQDDTFPWAIKPPCVSVIYKCKICNMQSPSTRAKPYLPYNTPVYTPPKQPEYNLHAFRNIYCFKCVRKIDYMKWCAFMFAQKYKIKKCCIHILVHGDMIKIYFNDQYYSMYINRVTGELRFSDGSSINITDPHFKKYHRLNNR